MNQFNLGMIGGGTVGSGVFHALQQNSALLTARIGVGIAIRKVAVKAFDEPRPYPITEKLMTLNWRDVVEDPEIHIVTELVGGTGIAKTMILAALERGKAVVTANKALISAHGPELFAAARKHNTSLYFEASVAGGIPIIKVLRESMVGNRIDRIDGIVNGTCNYILTRMKREGAAFADVLADAQRLGYAEADPTLDVDGHDAAHKIGILASLAHGFWVDHHDIHVEGIRSLTPLDIRFAAQLGYTIKLLGMVRMAPPASGKKNSGPRISVSVSPTLVPDGHVLASVNDVFNAVFVSGSPIGDTLYYGRGAGKDATASAILSDIADAALDRKHGTPQRVPPFVAHARDGKVIPYAETRSRFYLRLNVLDRAGVIAKISAIISKAGLSLSSIVQPEGHEGETVPLILMTHIAQRAAMDKAVTAISKLPAVKGPSLLLPVEDFG
ncbi:homoserine dehydrogenase [Opitutus terrae]|uniref:Homoserine dehydrogenase n=1 Tax=Opitutus terrae (strain DSM 11246 / JCM 15787 / PB90-1) TaxID=452637 RepID=B1ZPR5_OPITP|nr:homoserine dehydrogenase [Opitutus terrae]ACB75518.1 Homoserine dehydrogenase [Opitutus terrae PB90-1]